MGALYSRILRLSGSCDFDIGDTSTALHHDFDDLLGSRCFSSVASLVEHGFVAFVPWIHFPHKTVSTGPLLFSSGERPFDPL